jgi:hypothetical protein
VEVIHHKNDENVSEEESGNGNEEVRKKSRGSIVDPPPVNGSTNPDGKGKSPCENSSDNEKRQAVQKPLPDLCQHRLVVFP